ncbi:hypothetical protein GWK91_01495 [Virgibacillus sp. MSP4-1]|uniref:hypothetical protein n=1 Tax=Virgibacillus sp. MSP4-1 TaxID=2700081 RepID=UPI0003A23143|nr:hypothetical protein [Virgibacillus sp. MSP4-1]QHS21706.1 hypothetical protein GWK91_01495 [Virgibacillus sp. MSP4-1]
MSDRKREIHVKDLVIKADNVVFEPPRRRSADPFFGPPRHQQEENDAESNTEVDVDVDVDVKQEDDSEDERERRRPPFSWI